MKTTVNGFLAGGMFLLLAGCGGEGVEPAAAERSSARAEVISARTGRTGSTDSLCDRECLTGFVDDYIAALAANDPGRAPFAADARFTENAQELELGDALWGTASAGPQDYQIKVADPQTGNAGFFLLMEESGSPIWLAGRLQVEDREITELETVVIREGAGFGNFDLSEPDPLWTSTVPEEDRNSREELEDISNRYFESLEKNLVDYVDFDPSCNRLENGVKTANNPAFGGVGDGPNVGALDCRENINSGMWGYITEISPRRLLIADEERGIAMGIYMFHQDGSVEAVDIQGYGRHEYSGSTRRPFTTVIPEMFKIMNGRIYRIEAVMAALPYRSKSGWEEE